VREQRPVDARGAGGLGGFWGWGWEVIETVGKKQLGEA
jgi:phosphate/sulfate permease